MGYSTDSAGRLCCDKCGAAGGVRKRTCPHKVLGDSLRTIGQRRYAVPYCYAPALCDPCYRELGGLRGVHGNACRDGARLHQARADQVESGLDAGESYVISAAGTPPGELVRVTFKGRAGEVIRLIPYDDYNPGAKPRLSDYPQAVAA